MNDNIIKENLTTKTKELNYMITTYKGQSGSPLFIRIKNEKLIEMKKEDLINCENDKYSYIFLGLHSRSSDYIKPINKINSANNNPNNPNNLFEVMNQTNKKTMSNFFTDQNIDHNQTNNIINININLNNEINDLNINIDFKTLIQKHGISKLKDIIIKSHKNNTRNINNQSPNNNTKKENVIHDFLSKNNFCNYNIGLKIDQFTFKKIKNSIIKARIFKDNESNIDIKMNDLTYFSNMKKYTNFSNEDSNYYNIYKNGIMNNILHEKKYILIYIRVYDEYVVKGIFNITSFVDVLFEVASKYLEVDKKFILLSYKDHLLDFEKCSGEFILNVFKNKTFINEDPANINNDMENDRNPSLIFREIISTNFILNIDKYSDVLSQKLFSKLHDNIKNFEENKVYNNSNTSNIKIVIKYIFNEIQIFFEKSLTLYGVLFDAIKKKMVNCTNVSL